MRPIFILQCILGVQSQSIDFTNSFAQEDTPIQEKLLIGLPRYFKSDGGKCDVVIRLKENLYGQTKAAHLWYEKLQNGLLDCGFVLSNI